MSQTLGLDYDPRYEGFDPRYPYPPRVHWLVLLGAWIAVGMAIDAYIPEKYHDIVQSLVMNGWVFYVCQWIRRVNPESKSPFWCDVYLVVQLTCVALPEFAPLGTIWMVLGYLLFIGSVILGIVTIFMVKSDLEDHYNNREHAGLVLNGVLTFFCSFVYFQHHLYGIAKRKARAQGQMAGQLS